MFNVNVLDNIQWWLHYTLIIREFRQYEMLLCYFWLHFHMTLEYPKYRPRKYSDAIISRFHSCVRITITYNILLCSTDRFTDSVRILVHLYSTNASPFSTTKLKIPEKFGRWLHLRCSCDDVKKNISRSILCTLYTHRRLLVVCVPFPFSSIFYYCIYISNGFSSICLLLTFHSVLPVRLSILISEKLS